MKRGNRFLICAAVAVLTFGSLVAIEGPKKWSYYGHHHGWHHHHDCDRPDSEGNKAPTQEEEGT